MSPSEFLNIRQINVWDILDILLVWFVVYNLLRLLRGSRTKQMAFGLLALFLIQLFAERYQLVVLSRVIGSLFNIIPIAIIVIFQDEIRRVLASIGSNPFFDRRSVTRSSVLDNIFQAALKLSETETGALIIFEGNQRLGEYIESGTRMDAVPSTELLLDIFRPKSSLHDGAVIVSNSRLASAACLMPLSRNPNLPRHFGTRHRAAAGITEESDCLALAISEETGNITFFQKGQAYPVSEKTMSQLYEGYNELTLSESIDKIESLKQLSKETLAKTFHLSRKETASEPEKDKKAS